MLRINLLGSFATTINNVEITQPTKKTKVLTAYLAWNQGRWIRRDFIRDMLWKDASNEHAAGNLRTALYYIRRSLNSNGAGDQLLETRRDSVRLLVSPNCWVDARSFEESAMSGLRGTSSDVEPLILAASLYHGDFLEDMDEEWCLAERRRMSEMFTYVLRNLVVRLSGAGLHQTALGYALRWQDEDPLGETAYQALMRLYSILGQPARVMEQFKPCQEILQTELNTTPSDTTINMLQELSLNKIVSRRKQSTKSLNNKSFTVPDCFKKLSPDPLRNARLMLLYGETMIMQGHQAVGRAVMDRALAVFSLHKDKEGQHKARLAIGEAHLANLMQPQPKQALTYLEPVLDHHRNRSNKSEYIRVLLLTADACRLDGQYHRAITLARECDQLAGEVDLDAQARSTLVLGMALRDSLQLSEARIVLDQAMKLIPQLASELDILRIILNRGVLALLNGELIAAEKLLKEAHKSFGLINFKAPRAMKLEQIIQTLLIFVYHYRLKHKEIERLGSLTRPGEHIPELIIYMNSLLKPSTDKKTALKVISGWLRVRLRTLIPPMIAPTIRVLVENMLASGMHREASRWSALGIRISRTCGWPGYAALFHCHRAVALAYLNQIDRADANWRQAKSITSEAGQWLPAWLAYAGGLIARHRGNYEAGKEQLALAKQLFKKAGDLFSASQVEAAINKVMP